MIIRLADTGPETDQVRLQTGMEDHNVRFVQKSRQGKAHKTAHGNPSGHRKVAHESKVTCTSGFSNISFFVLLKNTGHAMEHDISKQTGAALCLWLSYVENCAPAQYFKTEVVGKHM